MHLPLSPTTHARRRPRPATTAALVAGVSALVLAVLTGLPTSSAAPAPAAPTTTHRSAAAGETGVFARTKPQAKVRVRRGAAREVGMRFRPRTAGTAVGVRYFKPMRWKAATPKRATLWTNRGKKLATTRIRPVKGVGWRRISFTSPVALTSRTTYVVSVHTRPKGIHAVTPGGFRRQQVTSHLRAPGGRNGVSRTTSTTGFPKAADGRRSNFWVDVRFVP